jgi:serine/threonine protein kinase
MQDSRQRDIELYSLLGKYRILSHVGRGGIATVYKAFDTDLRREVALKVLSPKMAANPLIVERFRREAQHVAKLQHRNIVSIYEFGEADGHYFLALEYVEGVDLQTFIAKNGQLAPKEAFVFMVHVTRALEHLHRHGIVHRDIKPANVLIAGTAERPIAKLTDLGMARIVDDDEFRVTKDGHTVGTIDYMAPEQARDSGAADIRSDIYSLGCTWYHMLAGRPPFADGNLGERLFKHLSVIPTDIRQFNGSVTTPMANVLGWMLAKDPADRYQTPAALMEDLIQIHNARKEGGHVDGASIGPKKAAGPVFTASPTPVWERQETVSDLKAVTALVPPPSGEQRKIASAQFERANDVLGRGDYDYAVQLLSSCCKLDPANLTYRRSLRHAQRSMRGGKPRGGRFSFITSSPLRSRLKAAKVAGEHLRVLEHGEALLMRDPWDAGAQLDMAEAADALGLSDMALWILQQAFREDSPNVPLSRALARSYEKHGNYAEAIAQWEIVRKADPNDLEASRKPRDLAARETIARGEYGRRNR